MSPIWRAITSALGAIQFASFEGMNRGLSMDGVPSFGGPPRSSSRKSIDFLAVSVLQLPSANWACTFSASSMTVPPSFIASLLQPPPRMIWPPRRRQQASTGWRTPRSLPRLHG